LYSDKVIIPTYSELEKVSFYESSLKKRNEDYEVKRKEALKLTFDKRNLEKELAMTKYKVSLLNKDFEIINSEIDDFTSTLHSGTNQTLLEKEALIESLKSRLSQCQEIVADLQSQKEKLVDDLSSSRGLLASVRDNLIAANEQIKILKFKGENELELKKKMFLDVSEILKTCAKSADLDRYISDRVVMSLQPTLKENEQLKLRVAQLNQELEQMTAEFAAEEAIHLKDELGLIEKQTIQQDTGQTKKFFTQGTLMLDCERIFD
jgi:hypothetical protein